VVTWQPSLLDAGRMPRVDPSMPGVARVALDDAAWLEHVPGWLSGADALFAELVVLLPWRTGDRHMYDRVVAVPRLRASASDVPDLLERVPVLRSMGDALSARYGRDFVSIGFNLYRDGRDSVAWHGDRIPKDAIDDAIVALVSVGEPRRFLVRPKSGGARSAPMVRSRARSLRFECGNGDLLVMGGTAQRDWEHCVPKVAAAGPRISIAYRHVHIRSNY
jgi:alkylated DNA repair dioxygenase AlkB